MTSASYPYVKILALGIANGRRSAGQNTPVLPRPLLKSLCEAGCVFDQNLNTADSRDDFLSTSRNALLYSHVRRGCPHSPCKNTMLLRNGQLCDCYSRDVAPDRTVKNILHCRFCQLSVHASAVVDKGSSDAVNGVMMGTVGHRSVPWDAEGSILRGVRGSGVGRTLGFADSPH